MLGYRVPAPDEAMLVSGGRHGLKDAPFRVVTGHGSFVMPLFRKARYLTLAMQESEVAETCVTKQGISLNVRAVIAFKVGNDAESIVNAGQRFLSDQDQMSVLTGRIFAGHLRSIIGSMTVEEIIRERQKLATEVLDASKPEMARLGLAVDAFQIESIDDGGSGYIEALSRPHVATVNQAAQIAEAQAQQAAAEAQQESERNRAAYERQTAVARAQYQAEIDAAQQKAAQAGPMAQATAQQDVLSEQAKVAGREAELRQAQLVGEVQRPAEAEAARIRTLADANAYATGTEAQATATAGGVILQRRLVDQMPQLIEAAAKQLAGANVTVLDGSDGMGRLVAGLAAQARAILTAAAAPSADGPPSNGAAPSASPAPSPERNAASED